MGDGGGKWGVRVAVRGREGGGKVPNIRETFFHNIFLLKTHTRVDESGKFHYLPSISYVISFVIGHNSLEHFNKSQTKNNAQLTETIMVLLWYC